MAAKHCEHGRAAGGVCSRARRLAHGRAAGRKHPGKDGLAPVPRGAAPVRMDQLPCQGGATLVRMDWLLCRGGPPRPPHLYGGRCHLPSLVEVQRDDLGEAGGVAVHAGAAIAKSLQDGVESLPLLRCGKRSGAVGCRGCAAGSQRRHRWPGKRCCSCAVLRAAAALESAVKGPA